MSVDDLAIRHGLTLPAWSMTEDFVLASGPGGQNVNKTSSAVQLRFFPGSAGVFNDYQLRRLLQLAGKRAIRRPRQPQSAIHGSFDAVDRQRSGTCSLEPYIAAQ